jgi:hypothetical protein
MKTILRSMLILLVVGVGTSWLAAQNTPSDTKSKSDTRTITGCLAKGDDANEFKIMGTDGSNWDLKSDSVSLADHVGHTVTVTGVVSHSTMHNLKEDTKDAAKDTGVKKDNSESGDLTVTDVQMVSNSCK